MGSDLEEIKSRLNIIDVLGSYLRIDKAGGNYRALCPFHNEKSPSFMISEEKQIWHCFGCGKGGDIFGFVMEMEGVEFREALKMLAERAGVQLQGFDPKKTEQKNRTLEILELSTKWYEYQLWNGPGKNKILPYLYERELRDETIREFRLGYAPKGWRNILTFLTKRGYKIEEIVRTGLLVQRTGNREQESMNIEKNTVRCSLTPDSCYDRFRERIMFPIDDTMGKIIGYSARVAPGGNESQAKYVNTPETEIYHKSRVLYGISRAKSDMKQKDFVLLVEGNMDVIAAAQSGIKNTIAVSGTALTPDQLGIIKRYTPNVRMLFDMDEAGQTATKKSVKLCLENDISVKIVELPFGKDAADVAKVSPEKLAASVEEAKDVVEYFFSRTLRKYDQAKVEDKKKIASELIEVIAQLSNTVEKNHWIKRLSELVNTPEQALTDMLKKATLRNRISNQQKMEDNDIALESKQDILVKKIIGLSLISPEAWGKAVEDKIVLLSYSQDKLLNTIMEKGQDANYSFDNLIKLISRPDLRERAEKIFFEHKYRLSINNNLEEISADNAFSELESITKEVRKEITKENVEKIIRDLKLAEEKKDQAAIRFLREELKRATEAISALS